LLVLLTVNLLQKIKLTFLQLSDYRFELLIFKKLNIKKWCKTKILQAYV